MYLDAAELYVFNSYCQIYVCMFSWFDDDMLYLYNVYIYNIWFFNYEYCDVLCMGGAFYN